MLNYLIVKLIVMNTTSDIEQLFGAMMQLGKLMSHQTHEAHEEKVATMLQFEALNFVKDQPNSTVSDLARFMQISKSSATQMVERLVKAGLVKRLADNYDRRITRLIITPLGEKEYGVLHEKMLGKMKVFVSKIPPQDLKELIRIHTELIEALKKEQNG